MEELITLRSVLRNLAKCYDVTVESLQDDDVELTPQPIDSQRWHQLHDRYWATTPVCGEPGQEQFAINKAIYWSLCECTGRALHPCRIVQVVTTVVPHSPDQYGNPMSSIYVTVIAEPMMHSQDKE